MKYGNAIRLAVLGVFCACPVVGFGPSPSRSPGTPGAAVSAIAARSDEADRSPSLSDGNPLTAIPLGSLHATRDRPLFSATRSPPSAAAAATNAPVEATSTHDDPPPPEAPKVTLVGVIKSPGRELGIFVDGSGKPAIRAHIGESVRGWTVSGVAGRAVTLEKAGVLLKLELQIGAAATVTPPDPSAPLQGMPVGPITPFATASR